MSKQHLIDTLFSSMARTEEKLHPTSTLLPNFPRSIQLDYYSCGAKSTYMILKYFNKRCTHESVEHLLGTTDEGTSPTDIKRVLRGHSLKVRVNADMVLRDLKSAINDGSPVLVSLEDGWHYSVVYGYSRKQVFVMNPSLGEMGSIKCAIGLTQWRKIWDQWGIIVRNK